MTRSAAFVAVGASTAGCAALPRSGPLASDMTTAQGGDSLEGLVVKLSPEVVDAVRAAPRAKFSAGLLEAAPIDPTLIAVDDVLDLTIWESEGAGVLNAEGGATRIEGMTVDPSGRVFVPFAGPQRAAGVTLAQLRMRIQAALEPITLSPQVDVRLREPRGRLVSVQGAVARPGVYPIERATNRLGAMIAEAGGADGLPEAIEVTLRRRDGVERQLLLDVFESPRFDVALRPGDQIVLSPIRDRFIVLGATTIQSEIAFPTRPLSLLSAIGAARGLRDFDADPAGVYVLRFENPEVADALLAGAPPPEAPTGPGRPIAYQLDMSEPEGFFLASSFEMRDDDALFVANAPLTELRKLLQLFNFFIIPVNEATTFAG